MNNHKPSKAKHIALIAAPLLVAAMILGVLGVSSFLVNYAIGRSGDGANRQVALDVDDNAVQEKASARSDNADVQRRLTESFMQRVTEEPVSIVSDGLTLAAGYYPQAGSHLWAIVVHGYRGNHYGMMNYAQRYYDAGYQVLAPDLRGCGSSDGNYVCMGWSDRLDMVQWMQWILAKDPEAKIVMHGVSMGGATVMMTSGEQTPDALVAFVEDCGYTSVWDIFSSELQLRFGLPTFPVLDLASMMAGMQAGWNFKEASSLVQVAKCEKPMLFIHGDQDDFVPFWMLEKEFNAKPGSNKQKLVVNGAGHGLASSVMGQGYWDTVFAFIDEAMQ